MKFKTLFVATTAAFVLCGFGLTSFADAQVKVITVRGQDRTVYKKKTVIDFEDSTVEGELVKPEQSSYVVRDRAKFNTLIKYRPNFVQEMRKTAHNL